MRIFLCALTLVAVGCSDPVSEQVSGPTANISLSASSAHVGMDTVTLTWLSTHAASCAASGSWTGEIPPAGTRILRPDSIGTFNYGIQCTGDGGVTPVQTAQLVTSLFTHSSCILERIENFWQNTADAPVLMGEYMPVNQVWMLYDSEFVSEYGLRSCTESSIRSPEMISFSHEWYSTAPVDSPNASIFGYPSVTWGAHWLWEEGQSTTPHLPAQIQSLSDSLRISFSKTITAPASHYVTLLILNTSPTAAPDPCRLGEINVIFDIRGNSLWPGNDTTYHVLGGTSYIKPSPWESITRTPSLLCADDPTSYYHYIQLWVRPFSDSGSVLVKPILTWLVDNGVLEPTTYLSSMNFGTEIGYGSGEATFTYSIRPN
jgi:hypothetical protein